MPAATDQPVKEFINPPIIGTLDDSGRDEGIKQDPRNGADQQDNLDVATHHRIVRVCRAGSMDSSAESRLALVSVDRSSTTADDFRREARPSEGYAELHTCGQHPR